MPIEESKTKKRWRYRRFWRLFRREKSSVIDITYSYQYMMRFPRLPITVPPLVPTLMSYRCGGSGVLAKRNDEDDCEPLPKKVSRDNHCQQHIRRRLPKRYSDIVGPSSNKVHLPRKDTTIREKQILTPVSQYNLHHTLNNNQEDLYRIKTHNKTKSTEILSSLPTIEKKEHTIVTRRYSSKNKHLSPTNSIDLLAQRMQAAMSTELMHSLDRNFVFGDKKHSTNHTHINRSHSFHISTLSSNDWWDKSLQKQHHYHMIPRVKHCLDDEQKSIETIPSLDEPTPDYDEDIIIRRINNNNNDDIGEEPIADYDDPKSTNIPELEDKPSTSPTLYDLGLSSSFIIPQTSITPTSEPYTQEQTSIPPTPPPLPNIIVDQKKLIFRCRTIADKITADHKLILKDEADIKTNIIEEKQSVPKIEEERPKKSRHIPIVAPEPCYLHLSKEILEKTILRKVSHPISRSYSTYGSMSQLNEHDTELTTLCGKPSIVDEQALDGLSSSATTSIVIENEYEHRSSSKIYNDYKRRTSLVNVPINNSLNDTYNHSVIIHPMHKHIGLRSSTSSTSTNDKPNDITLSNKQMNVCVINQLNEHLSTRFRKHQQQQQEEEIYSTKNTDSIQAYDQPLEQITNNTQTNLYDEPQNIEITKTISTKCTDISISSVPPPPPPLPVGGFRPVASQLNRPLSSQRTSIMTLPRETNGSDLGCSTGTSTISSKLSDTRILRELRTNPLFTKAKQHLEVEPGSNGRRSGRRLNGSTSYLRLDTCSKDISSTTQKNNSNESLDKNTNIESFIMDPNELNAVIGNNTTKRTKSMNSITNEIKRINSRTFTKSFIQTQCRQSELEIIFQKRAQRSEQNLT